MSGLPNSQAYPWVLTGIFAALHTVLSIIPAFPGIGGGALSLGMISGPLVGYLLGPIYGTLSVLIGSTIGLWANPTAPILGFFTVIPPTVGAFAAASIRAKKSITVPVIIVYALLLFFIGPIGPVTLSFMWLSIVAAIFAIIMMIPILRDSFDVAEKTKPVDYIFLILSFWILSFVAVMADHAIGSAIGVSYFHFALGFNAADLEFIFMNLVLPIYPIERISMATILAFVLFALDRALASSDFRPPLVREEGQAFQELPPESIPRQ
ncbi:MAG: hypothetical protein ACXAEF_03040 [Candidatus Thorarchaeota archaeon]